MSNVKNPLADLSDLADHEVPTATLQIYEFIDEYFARKSSTHINRASSATMCYKRRWYQGKGYDQGKLAPRVRANFLMGDLVEYVLKYFILKANVGPGKLYSEVDFGKKVGSFRVGSDQIEIDMYEQEDLTAKIGPYTFTAHVDGWGKRNSDGKWELIECKSAADFGFNDFKETGPGDYLKQSTVNLQTEKAKQLGATEVRFFYLRKMTSHLWDQLHPFDPVLADLVIKEADLANGEFEPEAPHLAQIETHYKKPTGRKVFKYPCSYCPFLKNCQGDFQIEFKSGKPIFVSLSQRGKTGWDQLVEGKKSKETA